MGRLTKINEEACQFCRHWSWCIEEEPCFLYEAYTKLAHYEDLEEQGRLIEARHGQWIPNQRMIKSPTAENYHCSECTQTGKRTSYCPHCGAKMELKELEGVKE